MCYNADNNTGLNPYNGNQMVAYTQRELVGSTELAKSLGGFIDKVVNRDVEKLAIVRHNVPVAVMLPINEDERMKAISDYIEDMECEAIINERMPEGKVMKTIPLEEMMGRLRQRGIDV